MRRLSIAILLCATTLFLGVPPAPAGQAQDGSSKPPAATTDQGQAVEPPCPGMASGTCCGACMEGQAAAGAAGPKAGQGPAECPCGKLKKPDAPAS